MASVLRSVLERGAYGHVPSSLPARARAGVYLWRASIYLLPLALILLAFLVRLIAGDIREEAALLMNPWTILFTLGISAFLAQGAYAMAAALDAMSVLGILLAIPVGLVLAHALGTWLEDRSRRASVMLAVIAALSLPWMFILLLAGSPLCLVMALPVTALALVNIRGAKPIPVFIPLPTLRSCGACDARLHPEAHACPECDTPAPVPSGTTGKG